jgi:hypothetical protein
MIWRMIEASTAKVHFTRRRVISVVVFLVFALCVAGLLGVFDRPPKPAIEMRVTSFTAQRVIPSYAEVIVSNCSEKESQIVLLDEARAPAGALLWQNNQRFVHLKPGAWISGGVFLPIDGGVVRVAVRCSEDRSNQLPMFSRRSRIRDLWWKLIPPMRHSAWIVSDQEIQCPKRLPDGSVEPPRLVIRK